MIQHTAGLEKSVKCNAAITAYTIGKFGADDDTMGPAAAATDSLVGVFQHGTSGSGEEVRIMLSGISKVKAGGSITRGDLVTSDGTGQAVSAAPGAGTNNRIVGIAVASASSGDLVPVLIAPSRPQG